MKFHVFDPRDGHGSYTIRDPDTHKVLGSVRLDPKITVTVVEVQEMLSLARTQTQQLRAMGPWARALMPPQWIIKYDTRESIADSDSLVGEGYPVIQVAETVQ